MGASPPFDLRELFGTLTAPQKKAMAGAFEVRDYAAGHVFWRTGLLEKRGKDTLLILLRGQISVETSPRTGDQVAVEREMQPGELFGVIAFLLGGSRTARVTALTPVKVARLSHSKYLELIRPNPELNSALMLALAGQLAQDMRLCNERLAQAVQKTAAK